MNRLLPGLAILCAANVAGAQVALLGFGEASVESDSLLLPVELSGDTQSGVAGLDFTLSYDPQFFELDEVTAGVSAVQADKTVDMNAQQPGEAAIVMMGVNQTAVTAGEVVRAKLVLREDAPAGQTEIRVQNPTLSSLSADPIPSEGGNLALTFEAPDEEPPATPPPFVPPPENEETITDDSGSPAGPSAPSGSGSSLAKDPAAGDASPPDGASDPSTRLAKAVEEAKAARASLEATSHSTDSPGAETGAPRAEDEAAAGDAQAAAEGDDSGQEPFPSTNPQESLLPQEDSLTKPDLTTETTPGSPPGTRTPAPSPPVRTGILIAVAAAGFLAILVATRRWFFS